MTKKLYKRISRIIMTKLIRNGRHTRHISIGKHASNINIHRSIKSMPRGVMWQIVAFGDILLMSCLAEKSTKKRGLFSPLKSNIFIHYHVAIFANIDQFPIQSHGYSYFIFYVSKHVFQIIP